MLRDLKVYLWDLQRALAEIETFTADKTFDDYLAERMLQRAVERDFILIGEILSRILHHFHIKDGVVWKIITTSVPSLKIQVDDWLLDLDTKPRP